MFLKITAAKGHRYLSLVRAYRENGVVKHEQLYCLGNLEDLKKTGQLNNLTRHFNELAGLYDFGLDDIGEQENKYCYGDIVYRQLWNKYGYGSLLQQQRNNSRYRFAVEEVAYLQVIDRLLSPQSRLALWREQNRYIPDPAVSLHQLYRCLDFLAMRKESLEWHTFKRYTHLFNTTIDVVFYDVTTFHFESVRADELRDFGFSKSGKFNEVQVVMGLLIDKEGHPIGFNLFPGSTAEGKTFVKMLDDLKKRFQIERVIFAADKALNSHKNLYALEEAGYQYIVSARIKNAGESLKRAIFDKAGYSSIQPQKEKEKSGENPEEQKETYLYKIIENISRRFQDNDGVWKEYTNRCIVTWSSKRARHDREERQRMVERAEKNYEKKVSVENKKGWKRYILMDKKSSPIGINQQRIEEDAVWDGYYGIETNVDMNETKPETIIDHLHRLWKIEETFRVYKTNLEAEPVFVWTPKRIVGHFVVCFLALVLERALEMKLKNNGVRASPEEIRNALNSMELSEVSIKNEKYYWKRRLSKLAARILGIFKVRQPPKLTPVEGFTLA